MHKFFLNLNVAVSVYKLNIFNSTKLEVHFLRIAVQFPSALYKIHDNNGWKNN